ncbi:MAG: hypothetical protein WBP61_13240 [Nocardioides sp.]
MITFRGTPSDLDLRIDLQLDRQVDRLGEPRDQWPASTANPRRTTWTGFAKADPDRLPAS